MFVRAALPSGNDPTLFHKILHLYFRCEGKRNNGEKQRNVHLNFALKHFQGPLVTISDFNIGEKHLPTICVRIEQRECSVYVKQHQQ